MPSRIGRAHKNEEEDRMTDYRVVATALNLRSTPEVAPTNRLAVLPQGTIVEKLNDTAVADWWAVPLHYRPPEPKGS
jgi:hypothetical protein